jgi:spore coat polysaccharide biosynthesis protein SpsF
VKTAVILASRINSKRFPRKVMTPLCGRPMLWHVLARAKRIPGVDFVIVAIPEAQENKEIGDYAMTLGCDVFIGKGIEEDDVLTRVHRAAYHFGVELIVRVTHDCPLLDPKVSGEVVALAERLSRQHYPGALVYASNCYPERTYEKGLDTEAFPFNTLDQANIHTPIGPWREHVTPWMQTTAKVLKGSIRSLAPERAKENWCVDFVEDVKTVERIMRKHNAPG